jgi:hypothetical protein
VVPAINDDVDQLLNEVLAADRVDIIGVLPWACAARLIELGSDRIAAGKAVINPMAIRYFTPARERITSYRHPGVLGTLVHRWNAGITGLRNWLQPLAQGPATPEALTIYEFDDVYLDCIVCTHASGRDTVTLLSQLPVVVPSFTSQEDSEGTVLVVTRMPTAQLDEFNGYLAHLVATVPPLRPRQVLCKNGEGTSAAVHGSEFRPIVSQLNLYGRPLPSGTILPVAVVAVCTRTPQGPAVLLKYRSEQNSRDDFGTLSLISERVLAEDFSSLMTGPLDPDHGRALDDLWLRAGQPTPFEVPESAFRSAAQRELFLTCGLDIREDRLDLRGSCLLDREGEDIFLGFLVFRLDIDRSPVDELSHARRWNPDLDIVPLSRLYDNDMEPRLNRLLRRRKNWLRSTVFTTLETN